MAPKGSEEECGWKPDNQYPVTDLHAGWMRDETREQVFGFVVIEPYRPHSSSVMEIAFGDFHDSFPPGEAFEALPRPENMPPACFLNGLSNPARHQ